MGIYNPSVPVILGQEWVPIRNEDVVYSPTVSSVETGHGFILAASRTVRDARFYAHDWPTSFVDQVMTCSIYPQGSEAESGPIQRIIIPCNSGGITGNASLSSQSANVADAAFSPTDSKRIIMFAGNGTASFFFAVNQYTALQGKRILGVNVLYAVSQRPDPTSDAFAWVQNNTGGSGALYSFNGPDRSVNRMSLGNINAWWNATSDPLITDDRYPWRYTELKKFEASSANRIFVIVQTIGSVTTFNIEYVALEIFYCEETRLLIGGKRFGPGAVSPYGFGEQVNVLSMRDIATLSVDPILQPGQYTAVLATGSQGAAAAGYPVLNGLREYYAMPAHPGLQVNIPFPIEDHLGDVFTQQTTHILPQLSLHATGSALVEPHVYGRQVAAPVYGSVTATQGMLDEAVGASTTFQQARFYARRFGRTQVPLRLERSGGPTQNVVIQPADFDALPELVDGWREVIARLATPATMGTGTHPSWIFSATGELVGNRWEVLGAQAPALSGIAGNLFAVSPQPLGGATYGQPSLGSNIALNWPAPPVSGSAGDASADLSLIFSQDPLTVTGVAAMTASQPITGIGLNCSSPPCTIPTGIGFNRITWASPSGTGVILDTFTRTVPTGWGTADTGQAWSTQGGSPSDFSVTGSRGEVSHSSVSVNRRTILASSLFDVDITVDLRPEFLAQGAPIEMGLIARSDGGSNEYFASVLFNTDSTITIRLLKTVATVTSTIASVNLAALTYTGSSTIELRMLLVGPFFAAKVWASTDIEPSYWQVTATDTSLTAAGAVGTRSSLQGGNTNTSPVAIHFDDLIVQPPASLFRSFELQRSDPFTDWKTIMLAASPMVTGFNDYEARVGVVSSYRIRQNNLYGFAGAWSVTVTATVTAPGVSGCDVGAGVLIFTSNERQNGAANLAYVMGFEQSPDQPFSFPEVDGLLLQHMYGRDFQSSYHGTERGGQRFSRTLLVQNGAVSPPALDTAFQSLRDLGWADLSYVCVRTELGDRWLATVVIPAGRVSRRADDSLIELVTVDIIEATETPSTPSG